MRKTCDIIIIKEGGMREALGIDRLKRIYGRIATGYDLRHAVLTMRSDQRGRRLLVENVVREGDAVLDCGAGTGTTGIMAAKKAGPGGMVTMFDLSDAMLAVAEKKAAREGLDGRVSFRTGDMVRLPFGDGEFDAVLSTYSLCPVYDPAEGALEMYRVTKPGGRVGVAHSTEPVNPFIRRLGGLFEDIAWRFPSLSMGCRAVDVLPALTAAGGRVVFTKRIGVPLWPFIVFVVEKPGG